MQLFIDELITTLSQKVRSNKKVQVRHIRPHLFLHNNPTGTLKVQICSDDGTLIAESNSVDMSNITDAVAYHGYVKFDVSAYLMENTWYTVKIVPSSYTYASGSYTAVCLDAGLKKYSYSSEIRTPLLAPLDLEIWSLKE